MPEEIKEGLSKTEYLYMGSVSEMAEIRADENIIRKALDELISEQSAKTCTIPISFARE